jgi:hypothetical protein
MSSNDSNSGRNGGHLRGQPVRACPDRDASCTSLVAPGVPPLQMWHAGETLRATSEVREVLAAGTCADGPPCKCHQTSTSRHWHARRVAAEEPQVRPWGDCPPRGRGMQGWYALVDVIADATGDAATGAKGDMGEDADKDVEGDVARDATRAAAVDKRGVTRGSGERRWPRGRGRCGDEGGGLARWGDRGAAMRTPSLNGRLHRSHD